jgi:hypothetical protein
VTIRCSACSTARTPTSASLVSGGASVCSNRTPKPRSRRRPSSSAGRRPPRRPSTSSCRDRNYHALGKDKISELIEGYYRAFFDSLAEATDTDYTVETYTDQQASPGFRAEFLRTLERLENIRWWMAPSHGVVHIRVPCPECGWAEKRADRTKLAHLDEDGVTFNAVCFDHGPYEVHMAAAVGRGVRFTVDVQSPAASVVADRERLYQVMVNLLDNAARHGPAGGNVHVFAEAREDDVVIEVRDEGPGIPAEERDRVFERFTRGERAGGGGTGLGLAIARWVVDLHGGSIGVVAPRQLPPGEPEGCRIRVVLPTP